MTEPTAEALESFGSHSSVFANVVRAQLVDNTGDGHGVSEELRSLSHFPVFVKSIKVSSIQVCIPARHVDQDFFHLGLSELKFFEESPTSQVVVVFVRLSQYIADLQMCLVVICPVLLATVDWYPAVRALEIYMGRRRALLGRFASFEIHRILGSPGRLMIGMRTVCMLSHKSCSLANLRYGRVRERIEEVVLSQD